MKMNELLEWFEFESEQLKRDIKNSNDFPKRKCSIFFDNNTPRLDFIFKSISDIEEKTTNIIGIMDYETIDDWECSIIVIDISKIAYIRMYFKNTNKDKKE